MTICVPTLILKMYSDWPGATLICSRCTATTPRQLNHPDVGAGLCEVCYAAAHAVSHNGRGCAVEALL